MKKTTLDDLVKLMAQLRAPDGCPWDKEQTHLSLTKYLKEESQEVIEAIHKNDMENLEEELGDVLLQILFHSQLASERGDFNMDHVMDTLYHKLVNRHPHVFANERGEKLTSQDVKDRWDELKRKDKEIRKSIKNLRDKI